jgi:CRP-like cAMP-binding protein
VGAQIKNLLKHPDFKEGTFWERRNISTNEYIFKEGDESNDVFIILKGSVRVLGKVALDDDIKVSPGFSDLEEGQVFGELPLFDNEPRSASVSAITDCELAVIDGDKLLSFLDTHPEIGYVIMKDIIQHLILRLRKANKRVFSLFAWGLKSSGMDQYL